MATRTYRFTITGELTVDDTTLRSALLAFEHVAPPDKPAINAEENFERQQQLAAKPPRDGVQEYLFHGHVRPMIWKLERDMPNIGYEVKPLDVVEVSTAYGPGDPESFRPVPPEER